MAAAAAFERRRHRRVRVEASIRLSTIDAEIDPWTGRPFFRAWEERCANLSRGGAHVRTHEPLALGRRVLIEVTLPGGAGMEAIGRVAWARPERDGGDDAGFGLGVEFLGGRPDQVVRLERFLAGVHETGRSA
jgi:uncharacterized protein (TIGR02266 family)